MALSGAAPAAAQMVIGQLVEESTGDPLEGAFVVLIDSAGGEHGGVLTNDEGRFFLRAPAAGDYRLRVERIGFSTRLSEPLALVVGETTTHKMRLSFEAIALEEIRVEGEQRCDVRPGEGQLTAQVWDEAQKALRLAAWTEEQEAVRFRVVKYTRELDPGTGRVLEEHRTGRSGYGFGSPFRSVSAEQLAGEGYIRQLADGTWEYRAPDAEVLLSDSFLDNHCFELRRSEDSDLIGLGFRPVERGGLPDIWGTMWLDRATAQLQRLDFNYTEMPYDVDPTRLGGFIRFARVRGGPWVVREWRIRMPNGVREVHEYAHALGVNQTRYEMGTISEAGGEVYDVIDRAGRGLEDVTGGSISGVVYDSTGFVGKAGATVTVRGAGIETRTDNAGRFTVTGLVGGRYGITVTPRNWQYPWPAPEAAEVEVEEEGSARLRVTLPTADQLAEAWCPTGPETPSGVIVGRATSATNGAIAARSLIVVSWHELDVRADFAAFRDEQMGALTTADDQGWFLVCGVPTEGEVRVLALPPDGDPERAVRRIWQFDAPPPAGTARIRFAVDQRLVRQELRLYR